MKTAVIIVGLGYGDEGKGLATDFYCRQLDQPIVIRFNGGHQAGHTVVTKNGKRHVFSNFGAGTFQGIPTYWSEYCTFSPQHCIEELSLLKVRPTLYIDPKCPVTTHYDILYNQALEKARGEGWLGSCGVGFGATVDRTKHPVARFYVKDLHSEKSVLEKLRNVKIFYRHRLQKNTGYSFDLFNHDQADFEFLRDYRQFIALKKENIFRIKAAKDIFQNRQWSSFIFEGAQGILLDKRFGKTPYVTKSNTTSRNALNLLRKYTQLTKDSIKIVYVTRAYQTRHGNGPFENSEISIKLTRTKRESNKDNIHQGVFRKAPLNITKLNYALACDMSYSKDFKKALLITCLDQLNANKIPLITSGLKIQKSYQAIPLLLDCHFSEIMFSFSSRSHLIKSSSA
jgi:adenylosuccinate synthase